MKSTQLKLVQVLSLNQEIDALTKEDLAYKTKYWLNKLAVITSKEAEQYEKIRIELVTKLGTKSEDGQNMSINPGDENFNKFYTQIQEVLSQDIEIEHCEFNIDDFDFKSGNNYPVFGLLI